MKISKLSKTITIILCLAIFCSTVANASGNVVELSQERISSQNSSSESVSAQAKTVGKKYSVWFLFAAVRSEPSPFSGIIDILFMKDKATVLSNSGFYSYVKTESGTKGYVFGGLLSSNTSAESNLISREYGSVYSGATRNGFVVAKNGNDSVIWSVSPSGIIDFDKETGTITGLKYGTATITARSGFTTDTCTIHCIYEWKKSWTGKTSVATSVRNGPGDSYDNIISIAKGKKFTVLGDGGTSENGADGWAYGKYTVNGNDYYGYVKINDISTKGTVSQYNNTGWTYPIEETKYNNIYSVYGWRNGYRHLGFDINKGSHSTILGKNAVASCAGKVAFVNKTYDYSNKEPDYGYCIIIATDLVDFVSGNKIYVVYMHLNEAPTLKQGDEVNAGKIVGKIGTTGNSTGPHLHLEINNKGTNFAGTKNSDSFDKTINPMFFYLNTELSDGNDSNNEYWYNDDK